MTAETRSELGTVTPVEGGAQLRLERHLQHPIQKVWDALTRPADIKRWFVTIDREPVVGETISMRFEKSMDNVVMARVLTLHPPHVFEHTFDEPSSPQQSIVRWELTEEPGGTRLVLTHTLKPTTFAAQFLAGWHTIVEMLPEALEGRDPNWGMEHWERVRDDYVQKALLTRAYDVFNARDLDAAMTLLAPDVEWPNGMEGGYVHGHSGVRDYWTRQWGMIDPSVTPESFELTTDGRVAVTVHQVVRDLSGAVLSDRNIEHVYRIRDGLIEHMEIRELPAEAQGQ